MTLNGERLVPNKTTDSFYLEHIHLYQFTEQFVSGKTVLDIGCGTGYGSAKLLDLDAKRVEAIDRDKEAVAYAERRYKRNKLTFRVADALAIPFKKEMFDVVISFEVIEHIKDPHIFIQEAMRVLKKGGVFICSTPNQLQYRGGTSPYHTIEFTPPEFSSLFGHAGYSFQLFGQQITNQPVIRAQKEYFTRYQALTFKNTAVKKLLHRIPSSWKTKIYLSLWKDLPPLTEKDFLITNSHIQNAVTLIGVCKKQKS